MKKKKKLPRPPHKVVVKKKAAHRPYKRYEIKRPQRPGVTLRIWEIADQLTKNTGKIAYRADVLLQAEREKIPRPHASTHYGRWRLFNKIHGYLPERTEKEIQRALKKLPRPPHAIKKTVDKLVRAANLDKKTKKPKAKAKLPRPPRIVKPAVAPVEPAAPVAPVVEFGPLFQMPVSPVPVAYDPVPDPAAEDV
jgi:hypothetical protein